MGIFGALVAVIWRGAVIGLDTGKLFSFVLYSVFIGSSIGGLAEIYTSLQKSIGATENLFQILDETKEPLSDIVKVAPEHQLQGNISFKNISFHYPSREDSPVLNGVSFNVSANQKVALVGPSGAGKSTIVSLLLRLYDPSSGHIFFDKKENQHFPLSALRSQMSVVPQDVFLFGGTIGENIAYGKQDATEEELIAAAKKANAWEFIQRFPLGLQTIVGERGIQLSGGQRQRIAIARALYHDSEIILFDEATSALDNETENEIIETVNNLFGQKKTMLMIAHRYTTLKKCSRIYEVSAGNISSVHTYQDLLDKTLTVQ